MNIIAPHMKLIFSFLLERLRRKRETADRIIPVHWNRFSLSPKMTIAPTRTSTGLVAFIGPAIVIGRCLMPAYPNIQPESTIADFIMISRWACRTVHLSVPLRGLAMVVSNIVPENYDEPTRLSMMHGESISVENNVLRKRTGSIALHLSDAFFETS